MKMLCVINTMYGSFHFWAKVNRQTAPFFCQKLREMLQVVGTGHTGPTVLSAQDAEKLERLCEEVITAACGPAAWTLAKEASSVYRSEFVTLAQQIISWAYIYEIPRAFFRRLFRR